MSESRYTVRRADDGGAHVLDGARIVAVCTDAGDADRIADALAWADAPMNIDTGCVPPKSVMHFRARLVPIIPVDDDNDARVEAMAREAAERMRRCE